jgi:transcriptional regulator with XRE-family HTH domain
MDPGPALRRARRRARLSQRELAGRTAVAQPTIARIEKGREDPRIATLDRLLRACGEELGARPVRGEGVDRTQIQELLRLTPRRRLELAGEESESLRRLPRFDGGASAL